MRTVLGRWFVGGALVLALAGCNFQDSTGQTGGDGPSSEARATAVSLPAETRPDTAATAPAAGSADGVQPVGLNQADATVLDAAQAQVDAQEQVVFNVFQRISPVVVRIETGQGLGSGWLYDTEGHIVTNNHVIDGAQRGQVLVSFSGPFQTLGQVVGTDPDSDIAVVKVEELPEGATPVELADSNQVRVGQLTVAIGNPLGKDRTVTTGIISAIGRTIDESAEANAPGYAIGGAIQTDASINPGNSGGPLLDRQARLIGMNTAILTRSGTSSGIGFAIPVNLIKKVVPALIADGRYDHPYLGVSIGSQPITTYQVRANNLPGTGVVIQPSDRSSPVAQAGITDQVILHAIDGVEVSSSDDVISYLEVNTSPGDTVQLTIFDGDGQQRDVSVELGARPSAEDR
ncbi:MAG TPA: trypsin-like peptidase domain-containing protein [Roseiflexaceae bacterium]|nr:trypsin-like peptidase domain-containing protein [Roseiflexaceae bacterium]